MHDVRKVGCEKDGGPKAYRCSIEVDLTAPMLGRNKSIKTMRLVDEGAHWQVLNLI